jgi:hypothetical protein
LLPTLCTRIDRFRNLDECTFKILELESLNKQVVTDFEAKLARVRREVEEHSLREIDKLKDEIELARRSK